MEEELKVMPDEPKKVEPSAAEGLNDKELEDAILKTTEQVKTEKSKEQELVLPPAEEPVKPVPEAKTEPDKSTEVKKEEVKPETQKAEPSHYDDLLKKKHWESTEQVADGYINLEKEFHKSRQELSQLRKAPAVAPAEPQAPADLSTINEQFMDKFNKDPIGTLWELQQIASKPVTDSARRIELKNEVLRLGSSPKTADFNLPEVQSKMQEIIKANPEKYVPNLTENLEDVYYLAKGRLTVEKESNPAAAQPEAKQPVPPVEGTTKPVPKPPFNPMTAPEDELKGIILNLQNQLK